MRTGTVTRPCPQPRWFTPWRCSVPRELRNPHLTRVDSTWIRGRVPPWRLWAPDGPNGFAESDVSGYYLWHTPRTPALVSRELGDSRRALACPGVVMCFAGPSRSSEVARRAGIIPCHEADPERAVRSGGRWWSGLTNSGGLRPGRIQRPAAGTRSGGSGEEYSGRSRRWHHPWRGASVAPPPTFPLGDRHPPLPQVSANTTTAQSSLGAVLGFPRCPIRPRESACYCRVPRGYAMACACG
jgi:hypothetical protein